MKDDSDPFRPLVERFQRGIAPDESFRTLFESFYRPVLLYFRRKGFGPEESEDLTQETLYRIFRSLPSFRFESFFSSWVFTVALNVYRMEVRRRTAQKRGGSEVETSLEELPASSADHPLDSMVEARRAHALREALARLPEQMRTCAILRYQQGLKYREIATILNVSIETVKAHLFQARKRLQDQLAVLD